MKTANGMMAALAAGTLLAGLKETEGVGEAFCRDYGAEVLGLMPDVTAPAPEKEGADGGGADETDKEIMESDESR